MNLFYITIIAIISLIFSLLSTRILIDLMPKLEAIDHPGDRRSHTTPTPRGAGISFVIIFSILLPFFEYNLSGTFEKSVYVLTLFLPISLVSFYEDISHVIVPIRLLIYAICSFLAIKWLIHPHIILPYDVPLQLDLVIGSFALLAFLNVYNFMDGIDGITSSESIHLSCTILLLCFFNYDLIPNVDLIIAAAVIIASWSLGFLYFNWHPAKIFLGDVGSIAIGFILGICILTIATASAKSFLACVIASLYYIADGGLVVLIRLTKGEKIWEPHLQHFFQRSLQKLQDHGLVVRRIIICNLFLMLLSISSLYYPIISMICAILVIAIILVRSVS